MDESGEYILITISGSDCPGIVSSIVEVLSKNNIKIVDIEQVVIHGLILLSLLVDLKKHQDKEGVLLKDLLVATKKLNLELNFKMLNGQLDCKKHLLYAVTCLGKDVSAEVLGKITSVLSSENVNIERINQLSRGTLSCIEMIVNTCQAINIRDMTRRLLSISSDYGVDIAVQKENIFRKSKRLVVMDMDSTLIQVEVIDELAKHAGVGDKVIDITHMAMNGKISFNEALKERVALLRGLDEKVLTNVYKAIPFTDGAKSFIKILKQLGYKTALISGGFSFFTDRIEKDLGLDYTFANNLEIRDGKVTGKVLGRIINAEYKASILEDIAKVEGIPLDQVVAIGDGANDLLMLNKAGLGIAFNAKQSVREKADYHISQKNLDSVIYLLGISEREKNSIS